MRPKLVSLEEIKTKINQTNKQKKNQRRGLAKGMFEVGEVRSVESSGEKSRKKLVWPLMYAVLPVTKSSVVSKLSMVAHICNPTSVGKRIVSSRPGWAIYSSETCVRRNWRRRGSEEGGKKNRAAPNMLGVVHASTPRHCWITRTRLLLTSSKFDICLSYTGPCLTKEKGPVRWSSN